MGSVARPVLPFRLRDLARLEAWAGEVLDSPRKLLAEAVALADPQARGDALRAAYDVAERGGPQLCDREVNAILGTAWGQAMQVWLALRGTVKGIRLEHAHSLAQEMTEDQWREFSWIAWGADYLDEVAIAIDQLIGVPPFWLDSESADWEAAISSVIRETGWTLATIGRLRLPQWDVVRRQGECARHVIAEPEPRKGWSWDRLKREVNGPRRAFWRGA